MMISSQSFIDEYKNSTYAELNRLIDITPTPQHVDDLQSEEDKKLFILAFRELSKILVKLETFIDFEFNKEQLGISEQQYQDYKSKYFTIYEILKKEQDPKTSILLDIDFGIELMHSDKINVGYIMNLIKDIDFSSEIGLSSDFLNESVAEYEYSGIINREEISNEVKEKLKPKFLERKRKIEQVKNFVYEHVAKYNI